MPTERKEQIVAELRRLIEGSTVAISADYTGMTVGAMTELRRTLRQSEVEFHVVKNRLTYLAADAASRPLVKEIVQGPTGIAFGFADPVEPARVLVDFIRANRSSLKIRGAVLGDRQLSAEEVAALAALPSREELIARLLGQLQAPIARLTYVLNAPLSGLMTVLQRAAKATGESVEAQPSDPKAEGESAEAPPSDPKAEGESAEAPPSDPKAEGESAGAQPSDSNATGESVEAQPSDSNAEGESAEAPPSDPKAG